MKKILVVILTGIIVLSSIGAFASGKYEALESLGNYGDLEYIYDNMEVSYDYNGERVYLNKEHMTYKECEVMLQVLSDEKLSFKDIKTTEAVEPTDDLFPKKGYVEFLDENDGNWIIAFDENEVYARCVDPINKTFRHGFFSYKLDTMYNSFRAFLDNIVKGDTNDIENTPNNPSEDKPSEPETEKHENQINVYDMKQIYSASFPLGNFGSDFSWGICSYTRENETEPVTVAYLTFEDMEFLRVLTETEIKNNKIVFDNKRVAYFEKGTDGIEYDMNFSLTNDFELQLNVNDNKQVEYAVMTYKNVYSGASPETEIIDMSKYQQSGQLPTNGKISFDKKYNSIVDDNTDNELVETLLKKEKDSLMNFVSLMEEDSYIAIKLSKTENDYGARHTYVEKSNKTDLTNFINGLFTEIEKQKTGMGSMSSDKYSYCDFKLRYKENSKWVTSDFEIQISNDSVYITNQSSGSNSAVAVSVKDASKLIDYIYDYSKNKFLTFENKNSEDNIEPELYGTIKGLTKTDVIDFEFKQAIGSNDYVAKHIATPGKTIKAVFERYKENNYKSTYILKLSGDLGEVSLWKTNQSSLIGDEEIYSNNIPISFSTYCRSESEKLFNYGTLTPYDKYDLKLIFRDNDIYEVYFDNAKCSNLKYAQLTDDKKLAEEFVEKDKEVVLREAQECADTLYDFGLFKGTDKGYELEKSLTREESATILVRLLGEEDKIRTDDFDEVFVDVDKARWSYAYVMYCYKNNITKGTGADTFSPDVQIDANQFITLMMRLLGYSDVEPDTALQKSVEYKLLPQEKIDELTKKKVFTRSDMVQIVYNSLKTQMDDETVFADYLLEKGILTEKEIEQIK
ncbi:MAG: S-layer homology domain-containing protein [Clostridia bacterium]|nr:S-layer homology domain-containing protein [Clostridia bacterium]